MIQLHIQSPLLTILHDQLQFVVSEINLLLVRISTEGRCGCDWMMSINAPLMSISVNFIQDSGLTRPILPKKVCMVVNVSNDGAKCCYRDKGSCCDWIRPRYTS